jgi:RNA polymerase sigma-70 factor (ECF subfamily)|tara:strand:+ start:193 stop:801 length:609 start_codon:yes stop_codon:yes gene_type:complete
MKTSNKDIDLSLVKRAKAGDLRAFDLLVLKYQGRLISTAYKFVKDRHIAEDIAQESFIKSFKSLSTFREDSTFYTWIYRITVNTAKNFLVSKKRKDELLQTELSKEGDYVEEAVTADTPEDLLNASELKNIILNSVNLLGEDTKTAFSLREFEGLSYEQIAKVIDCPVGTVRSRIFRGREIIDDAIKKYRHGIQTKKTMVNK